MYHLHAWKLVVWLRERTSRLPFQLPVSPIPPVTVQVTEVWFIGSLKPTTTTLSIGTSSCPSVGSVVTMYGLMHVVVNVQGFGAVPPL